VLPNPSMFGSALSDLLTGSGNKRQRPDFRQSFYLSLAKVLGAAAWIDGPINQAEVNVVKSLLNELSPRLTTRELQRVQRYLVEPVPREHWMELLAKLSEFTRRRARLEFALERLQALLSADGEPNRAENGLYHQAHTLLGWRDMERAGTAAVGEPEEPAGRGEGHDSAAAMTESAAEGEHTDGELPAPASGGYPPGPAPAGPETEAEPERARTEALAAPSMGAGRSGSESRRGAAARATASEDRTAAPAVGGIRLGDLDRERRAAASPTLVDRVLAAGAARLPGRGGGGYPPRKLAVLAAALAYVSARRAGTEGEDAELVGFTAAVSGVDDAVAEAVLEVAREQPATGAELAKLAAELSVLTSPLEIAALAKLLNAMADGEAALRRLRDLTGK